MILFLKIKKIQDLHKGHYWDFYYISWQHESHKQQCLHGVIIVLIFSVRHITHSF